MLKIHRQIMLNWNSYTGFEKGNKDCILILNCFAKMRGIVDLRDKTSISSGQTTIESNPLPVL